MSGKGRVERVKEMGKRRKLYLGYGMEYRCTLPFVGYYNQHGIHVLFQQHHHLATQCLMPHKMILDCAYCSIRTEIYLQQNKKKAEAEVNNCHAKTMWRQEKPIQLE